MKQTKQDKELAALQKKTNKLQMAIDKEQAAYDQAKLDFESGNLEKYRLEMAESKLMRLQTEKFAWECGATAVFQDPRNGVVINNRFTVAARKNSIKERGGVWLPYSDRAGLLEAIKLCVTLDEPQ